MTTTKFKCIFCGEMFNLDDISKPIYPKGIFDFVWVPDACPKCHRYDRKFKLEWYITDRMIKSDYYQKILISRTIRYCRIVKRITD